MIFKWKSDQALRGHLEFFLKQLDLHCPIPLYNTVFLLHMGAKLQSIYFIQIHLFHSLPGARLPDGNYTMARGASKFLTQADDTDIVIPFNFLKIIGVGMYIINKIWI